MGGLGGGLGKEHRHLETQEDNIEFPLSIINQILTEIEHFCFDTLIKTDEDHDDFYVLVLVGSQGPCQ